MTATEETLFDPGPAGYPVPAVEVQAGSGHVAVRVTHDGRAAGIDEPLAPLILELWKAGIDTRSCCQGSIGDDEGGLANIVLPATDAEEFLTLLTTWPCDVDLYGRVLHNRTRPTRRDWRFHAWPYDEGTTITMLVKVFFPLDDVPELVRRLHDQEAPR